MKTEERNKKLEDLAKSGYGKALIELIEEKINEINTIEGCKSIEDVMGRQWAVKYLKGLFRFLNSKKDKTELTDQNQYI